MNTPRIRISGKTEVTVDPITTIDGLLDLAARFTRLQNADLPATAANLAVNTGDLIASARGDFGDEDMSEEVADVLISALVLATLKGLNKNQILEGLRTRLERQATEAIAAVTQKSMHEMGFGNGQFHIN